MLRGYPSVFREQIANQAGVVCRRQVVAAGISDDGIKAQLRAQRWRRLYRGVYLVDNGAPARESAIWAAVLYAGSGAATSHHTAAELWGLVDTLEPDVHVTIPFERRVQGQPGLQIHRSVRIVQGTHPAKVPPRIRLEETVLDLVDGCNDLGSVIGWITRAVQRRRTVAGRLRRLAETRPDLRWRKEILGAFADVDSGAESPLEVAYLRKVERPHRLPVGERNCHPGVGPHTLSGIVYGTNASTVRGFATLRYGWGDVMQNTCQVAAEVAKVLRANGWLGSAVKSVRFTWVSRSGSHGAFQVS